MVVVPGNRLHWLSCRESRLGRTNPEGYSNPNETHGSRGELLGLVVLTKYSYNLSWVILSDHDRKALASGNLTRALSRYSYVVFKAEEERILYLLIIAAPLKTLNNHKPFQIPCWLQRYSCSFGRYETIVTWQPPNICRVHLHLDLM